MSADGNAIVPVDVVQGIVSELAMVSQHTFPATRQDVGRDRYTHKGSVTACEEITS